MLDKGTRELLCEVLKSVQVRVFQLRNTWIILEAAVGHGVCGALLIHQTGDRQKRNLKQSFNYLLNKIAVNCGF